MLEITKDCVFEKKNMEDPYWPLFLESNFYFVSGWGFFQLIFSKIDHCVSEGIDHFTTYLPTYT